MTSLYREILSKAWQITKKFIYLWPLGFFVSFLGNTGEYGALINQIRKINGQAEAALSLKRWFLTPWPAMDLNFGNSLLLALFLVLILAIILAVIWLIISSVGGLIKGTINANQNKSDTVIGLLTEGSKKFVPIFGLYFIAKVIIFGILALILTPLMLAAYLNGNYLLNSFIIFLSIIIFVPLVIIVSFVTRFASAYVVLKGQKMWEAFKNGWRLFAANWLISLEMAALLLLINFLISFVILLIAFILFAPFFFVGIINSFQNPTAMFDIISIPLLITVIITVVLGSIFATFQIGSWTLLFQRLTEGKKAHSKLVRIFAALATKFKKS